MIEAKTAKQRRKASQPAEIVKPRPGPELMKSVKRLQRQAPLLAFQGLSELSVRLRQLTGRDVIDLNRVMEVAHFVYLSLIHISEPTRLGMISYAVFCLKKKKKKKMKKKTT